MSSEENSLHISWHDSAWIPHLKQDNILDYFANRSNPFYDRTCNNEIIKMQRVSPDQLKSMTGLEYVLLHVQEPILYIIRKQHRHTLEETTPLADYYIIDGRVYQAPDLCAVINARMTTAVHNIRSGFEESLSYSNYHPSKGYWWEFKDKDNEADKTKKKKPKEELSSIFQRKRVDVLLGDLSRKFPFKVIQPKPGEKPIPVDGSGTTPDSNVVRPVAKEEIKEENNQSQNNANTAVQGPSVPSIASGVTVLSGGGGANAAAVGGNSVVSNSAGVVSGGSSGGGGGGGTFFASSGGPSSVKPSVAKKRKIMGK